MLILEFFTWLKFWDKIWSSGDWRFDEVNCLELKCSLYVTSGPTAYGFKEINNSLSGFVQEINTQAMDENFSALRLLCATVFNPFCMQSGIWSQNLLQACLDQWQLYVFMPHANDLETRLLIVWQSDLLTVLLISFLFGRVWFGAEVRSGSGKTHFPLLVFVWNRKRKIGKPFFFPFSFSLLHFCFILSFSHLQGATVNFIVI